MSVSVHNPRELTYNERFTGTIALSAGRGSIGHEIPYQTEPRRMCSFRESRTRRQAGTVALDADTTLVTPECGFVCVAEESGFCPWRWSAAGLKGARKTETFLSLPWQQWMLRSITGKLCRQRP